MVICLCSLNGIVLTMGKLKGLNRKHYISTIEDYLFSVTNRSETSLVTNYTSAAHRICSSKSIQATYLHPTVFGSERKYKVKWKVVPRITMRAIVLFCISIVWKHNKFVWSQKANFFAWKWRKNWDFCTGHWNKVQVVQEWTWSTDFM